MTGESSINFDAPAELRKWPSLNNQRRPDRETYMVTAGPLDQCIREFMAKPEAARPVRNPYGPPTAAHRGGSVPRVHSRAFAAANFPVRQPFQKATTGHNSAPFHHVLVIWPSPLRGSFRAL
jgi:hypothetical protein